MSTQVQIRRGNTAQTAAFTGVVAELTVDTDKKVVVVHDGTTAGGNPLIKANASITTGQILTSNGSHLLALSNTGAAGTYGNASFIPVVTTDAYGRVSSVTNTAIAISSGVVTGVMTFAQGGANATSYTTGGLLTSNGTSFVSVANTGTAGTYANAAYIPVITTDAYGRVSAVTNTAVAIDTSQLTSGTVADARLPTKGTAGTYANSTYIPVITTDAYGRVTAITNTVIQSSTTSVQGIVQLTDSISSTSTTTAATPNSVKTAYDLATTANTNAVNAGTYANAAFAKANSANVIAQAAFDNSNTKFNSSGGSISGDVSVTGNLTIIGQTIYANTTTALIADNIITLNAAINQASAPTVDAGFEIDRGSSANVSLLWNETSDKWTFTNDGTNYLNIADAGRLDSSFNHANGAFTVANSATTTAQNAYNLANGTAGVANTDFTTLTASAGTYGNASHVTVTTLTANGRVSSITNTSIAIDTAAITSGTLADARLPDTGTAGTYANASHVPVITTDSKGRVTAVTNTAISFPVTSVAGVTGAVSNTQLLNGILTVDGTGSGLDADKLDGLESASFANAAFANTDYTTISATAGVYGNASHVPVTTLTANGRVSLITNTAIAIDTAALTSGTIVDARLPTKGTAGTYANATHVPVITTDAYGRVTAVTNTAISFPVTSVGGQTGAVSNTQLLNSILAVDGVGSGLDADLLDGFPHTAFANASFANTRFASSGGSITGDVTVTGNLTIVGQTVYANTTTALIADNIITLNAAIGQASAPTVNAGIEVDRGSSANVLLLWNETTDKWQFTNDGSTYFDVADAGRLDSVFSLANGTAGVANTDYTTISATAGVYGNAAFHPVVTLTANGRVSSITNTAIAISADAVTSGTLAVTRGGTGVTTSTGTGAVVLNTSPTLSNVSVTGLITVSGNVRGNYVVANTAFASAAGLSKLELSDIGLVGISVAGQTFQFGGSGIESNQGIFGGSFGGNRLSLNNETNLISNRYDTVKIQTGTTGTTVNDFIFANNTFSVPGLFTTVSANITSTTASTSNTTGALTVLGGVGVKGNVSANGIIFDDGTRQTTAASGGATLGDVLALSIALG
jgi:hypothetical protein